MNSQQRNYWRHTGYNYETINLLLILNRRYERIDVYGRLTIVIPKIK